MILTYITEEMVKEIQKNSIQQIFNQINKIITYAIEFYTKDGITSCIFKITTTILAIMFFSKFWSIINWIRERLIN